MSRCWLRNLDAQYMGKSVRVRQIYPQKPVKILPGIFVLDTHWC